MFKAWAVLPSSAGMQTSDREVTALTKGGLREAGFQACIGSQFVSSMYCSLSEKRIYGESEGWLGELVAFSIKSEAPYDPAWENDQRALWPKDEPPLWGRRVQTLVLNAALESCWSPIALASKKWGRKGRVVGCYDIDGLVYVVRHGDGSIGYYDPTEIEAIEE
jgi:hypothetical protein